MASAMEKDLKAAAQAGGLSLLDDPNRDENGCLVGQMLQRSSGQVDDPVKAAVDRLEDGGWSVRQRGRQRDAPVGLAKMGWSLHVRDYAAKLSPSTHGFVALLATKDSCQERPSE